MPILKTLGPTAALSRFTATDRAREWIQGRVIERSRGGITTRVMALVDTVGTLTSFRLLPGQANDLRCTGVLIDAMASAPPTGAGVELVIAPKSNRRFSAEFDIEAYNWRHLIENLFARCKEYRGIALRCCKTDESSSALPALAATNIRSYAASGSRGSSRSYTTFCHIRTSSTNPLKTNMADTTGCSSNFHIKGGKYYRQYHYRR